MIKILEDREKRYEKILKLCSEYKLPVLCGKINYPGSDKNTLEANLAFNVLYSLLNKRFINYKIHSQVDEGYDGQSLLMVLNMDKLEAKIIALEIEEKHFLGRIFDIDIYVDGVSISRKELGFKDRKCILCGEDARVCARNGKHKVDEVLKAVNQMVIYYIRYNDAKEDED